MSERMVIVIEYEVITDKQTSTRDSMQRALTDAMTRIREGADRLDPEHVKVVGVHVGVDDFVDRVLGLFAKDASAPNGPPSSPVETTGGETGTSGPDALNGLTSAAYSDVIRREADEGSYARTDPARFNTYLNAISGQSNDDPEAWVKFSTRCAIADACMAVADAEHAELWDNIVEVVTQRDAARRMLAESAAEVERLMGEITRQHETARPRRTDFRNIRADGNLPHILACVCSDCGGKS